MSAQDLIARLNGVQGKAPRWRACCPAHGSNKNRSLSIREEADGRVLVHCFGGCDVAQVLGAVGLELDALFPPTTDDPVRPRVRNPFRADALRELPPALTGAWMLLRKLERGQPITKPEREAAARFAAKCEELLQALA